MRVLAARSVVAIVLLAATGAAACAPSEPEVAAVLAPAPIDTEVPEGLSSATFAAG
jgi:hypothetical protein